MSRLKSQLSAIRRVFSSASGQWRNSFCICSADLRWSLSLGLMYRSARSMVVLCAAATSACWSLYRSGVW